MSALLFLVKRGVGYTCQPRGRLAGRGEATYYIFPISKKFVYLRGVFGKFSLLYISLKGGWDTHGPPEVGWRVEASRGDAETRGGGTRHKSSNPTHGGWGKTKNFERTFTPRG